MNWKNITLQQFQQISIINADEELDEADKLLFIISILYDKTDYQLGRISTTKLKRLINSVNNIFTSEINIKQKNRFGIYKLNYDIASIRFGQYVELSYFIQQDSTQKAHNILASIAAPLFFKNDSKNHSKISNYFLKQPITNVLGSIKTLLDALQSFNENYKGLFDSGIVDDNVDSIHPFNKYYGWIYSATLIKEHEGITLEQAFNLPVRQALNALAYLKSKGLYEEEQLKKQYANN